MSSIFSSNNSIRALAFCMAALLPCGLAAQIAAPAPTQSASPFQGSVAQGEVSAQPVNLTLDDAIQRGLRTNLGVILSGTQTAAARGAAAQPVAGPAALGRLQGHGSRDAERSARRRPAHSRLSQDHRAFRIYRFARHSELVAGRCRLAAQLSGRPPQLCRRNALGPGRARAWWCSPWATPTCWFWPMRAASPAWKRRLPPQRFRSTRRSPIIRPARRRCSMSCAPASTTNRSSSS